MVENLAGERDNAVGQLPQSATLLAPQFVTFFRVPRISGRHVGDRRARLLPHWGWSLRWERRVTSEDEDEFREAHDH
jgi:hypothetical protein